VIGRFAMARSDHYANEQQALQALNTLSDDDRKRIVVDQGKRLSLQRHRRRSEHWHVVRGEGLVTRGEERIPVREGDSLDIPMGEFHRVQNVGAVTLVIIEVQRGDYFGEDDIERIEDDFGRA